MIKDNMLFVLKATGWTIKEDMDRKIDEVLDKVGMKDYAGKCHIKFRWRTTTCRHCQSIA
jgi:ABC-type proline/glycine betaine transport system ATPase subunit